jgi:protein-disulfide isomerase
MNHQAPNRGAAALLGAAIVAVAVAAFAQTASLISPEAQKRIIDAPGVSVLGATSPDVVVVEYFEFNCPFCRKLAPSFRSLLKSDPKVAVVLRIGLSLAEYRYTQHVAPWRLSGSVSTKRRTML